MASQSTQTRGFLFADLRGYSAYADRRGDDAARDLLRRYRQLVRAEIERHGGAEIRTEGDSFYVVFGSVREAVLTGLAISEAASAASAKPSTDPITVGIGIHAGETSDDADEGIVSSAVNIAARVCAVAGPGAVLVTDTVRALTRTALPIHFAPQGRRRLKGIAEPVTLYRVTRNPATESRRSETLPLIAVAAAVVIVAAVGVRSVTDSLAVAEPSASPGDPPTPAASPDGPSGLARFFDDEFPNEAEEELRDLLLADVSERCERADMADVPQFRLQEDLAGVVRPFSLRIRAGLSCLTDSTRVHYWQGTRPSELGSARAVFFDLASRLSVDEGDCATQSRVRNTWEAGLHSGQVLCYVNTNGEAVIVWTFDDANIYATARRHGAETRALYEWWRETGVRLGR